MYSNTTEKKAKKILHNWNLQSCFNTNMQACVKYILFTRTELFYARNFPLINFILTKHLLWLLLCFIRRKRTWFLFSDILNKFWSGPKAKPILRKKKFFFPVNSRKDKLVISSFPKISKRDSLRNIKLQISFLQILDQLIGIAIFYYIRYGAGYSHFRDIDS